jgi:uncharacterized OB-fold protein
MAAVNEIERIAGNELYGAAFRQALKNKKLTASKCQKCSATFLPPRPICPECHEPTMAVITIKGTGKLVAFTVITTPPPLMVDEGYGRNNPYCAGVVELDEGVKVTARILGVDVRHPEEIKIGTPVDMEFQEISHYGEKRIYLAFRTVK